VDHHSSPLGIAGRPDQSSSDPGASFQFGRTSIRLFRAPHLLVHRGPAWRHFSVTVHKSP